MKFKIFLFFILIFTFSKVTNGQSSPKTSDIGKIGITVSSLSSNDIIYFRQVNGSAGYDGEDFFSVGITFSRPLYNWLEIETAVEYAEFAMEVNPPFYPGMDNEPYNTEISLLDIPVTLRANFLKYFYANSGILIDFDMRNSNSIDDNSGLGIDDQSGIGGMLGVGAKYDFDFGTSIFINPYLKMHSIFPFSQEGTIQQRLTESAIRFGITYQL